MKRIVTLILVIVLAAVSLASCGGKTAEVERPKLDKNEIKLVTAMDAIFSSYLYVISDKEAIGELVELYNSVEYAPVPEGEEVPDLYMDKLYMLYFHDEEPVDGAIGDAVAELWISPKGYIIVDESRYSDNDADDADSLKTYKLTSDFDEDSLAKLLKDFDASSEL